MISLIAGLGGALPGLIPESMKSNNDEGVNRIKEWIRTNYNSYPIGVEDFERDKTEEVVTIVLSEPLETDTFADVAKDLGYETETSEEDDGHSVINIYRITEYSEGGQGKQLRGTFHESKKIPIGRDPVRPDQADVDQRLEFLVRYLDEKHS